MCATPHTMIYAGAFVKYEDYEHGLLQFYADLFEMAAIENKRFP